MLDTRIIAKKMTGSVPKKLRDSHQTFTAATSIYLVKKNSICLSNTD